MARPARIVWRPLARAPGELNAAIKADAEHASGAYAVRERDGHRVVYVGESNRGRMWRTLLRHFQAPESFRKVRESGVFSRSPEKYEVALWVTSKGARSRKSGKAPDEKAMVAQAEWIADLKPTKNTDDGLAYPEGWDDFDEIDDSDDGSLTALLNPATPRTALGRVTELRWREGKRERVRRWAFGKAPMLVYGRGPACLAIVFDGAPLRKATAAETREYRKTHWGEDGERQVIIGEVAQPPFRRLGRGTSITYTTRKGDEGRGELVDYVHKWGDGARGVWLPPFVVGHVCKNARCRGAGDVALQGGTYRVTAHGIVG